MKIIENFYPDDWEMNADMKWINKTTNEVLDFFTYRYNADRYHANPENHVFEAINTHAGENRWQYFYQDSSGCNQHSAYFETKHQAIEAYRQAHPRMVSIPETMVEQILRYCEVNAISDKLAAYDDFTTS